MLNVSKDKFASTIEILYNKFNFFLIKANMQIVNGTFQAKIEIKKSIFLSFICPFKDFKTLKEQLKNEHSKATHFVYGYRILNELNQIIEDKNDDKEPKGTSGMATLNALRKYDLVDTAIITVRYFGGIKLGTGGLTRAYNNAAHMVINSSILIGFELKKDTQISIDFKILNRFEHFLKSNFFDFTRDFYNNKVRLNIKLNEKEEQKFEIFCKNFTPSEIEKL